MICPQCGKNSPSEFRCDYCGYELVHGDKNGVKKRFSMQTFLRAVLGIALAIAVMYGCQSCVVSSYTTTVMINNGMIDASTDLSNENALKEMVLEIADKVNEEVVLILLVSNLLTILVLCLFATIRRRNPANEMYVRYVSPMRIPLFALLGMALNVFVSVTLAMIPFPESFIEGMSTQYADYYGNHGLFIEILSVAVVTGITEELIFRGIAVKQLSKVFDTRATIIISAVIFGLVHGTPIAVIYATFMGLILGYAAVSYKSIVVSIVCHVFFNLTSYLLPYDNSNALLALYIMSVAAIAFCVYRLFIRRPTFYDLVLDKNRDYEYINKTEEEIIERVKAARNAEVEMLTPEELEKLYAEWEENRAKHKEERKYNKK